MLYCLLLMSPRPVLALNRLIRGVSLSLLSSSFSYSSVCSSSVNVDKPAVLLPFTAEHRIVLKVRSIMSLISGVQVRFTTSGAGL